MKILVDYYIASHEDLKDLNKEIKDGVNNMGYELQGGVSAVRVDSSHVTKFHQAMVKYEEIEEEWNGKPLSELDLPEVLEMMKEEEQAKKLAKNNLKRKRESLLRVTKAAITFGQEIEKHKQRTRE